MSEQMWSFLEVLLAGIGIFITIIIPIFLTQYRELTYKVTKGKNIYDANTTIRSDLVIRYKNRTISGSLNTVIIEFKNSGNQPLISQNEKEVIMVSVSNSATILYSSLVNKANKPSEIKEKNDENICFLLPYMEPRDVMRLDMIINNAQNAPVVRIDIPVRIRTDTKEKWHINSYISIHLLTTLYTTLLIFTMWEILNSVMLKNALFNIEIVWRSAIKALPLTVFTVLLHWLIYIGLRIPIKPSE